MTTQLIVTREHTADGLLPVRHLSYSAIRSFLQSENLFFKRYVRLEFDTKEKPSMLVGKAAHETTEKFWQDLLNAPETIRACEQQLGDGSDSGLTGKAQDLERSESHADFYAQHAQGVLTRMLQEARAKAAERLGFQIIRVGTEEEPETAWANKAGDILDDDEVNAAIEAEAIEWSKTVNEEKAREQLSIAVRNYIRNADTSTTISTEVMETVEFSDLDGAIMPLPLKGIIDRIERHPEHGEGLRDYKFVAGFSNPEERNAGYELQAAAFYFVYQGIRGKAPEYAMFEEVLKKEPGYILPEDPNRRLLQADLKELCDKNGIEYEKYSKNAELQAYLIAAGVLKKESSVQRIVYKYSERQDILEAFLEIYKRILNRLGLIALYNVPYGELVNPFDQMNGAEAWQDFTEGLGQGADTMKRKEKEDEITALDEYDF